MLKVVVFDCGYGGELFADKLEAELPIVSVVRAISWRDTDASSLRSRSLRSVAEEALRPYIGKVDLIIFANYLLATTSLRYFSKKYQNQKFIGFKMCPERIVESRHTLILTTTVATRNLGFFAFAHKMKAKTLCLDGWPFLIDNGTINRHNIEQMLQGAVSKRVRDFSPEQILLTYGQFAMFAPELRRTFGHNVRIVDGFDDTIRDTYRALGIKGAPKRKK